MRVALHNPSSVAVHTRRNHSSLFGLSSGSWLCWGPSRPGFGNAELNFIWQPDTRHSAGINQGVKTGLGAWEEAIKLACEIQSVGVLGRFISTYRNTKEVLLLLGMPCCSWERRSGSRRRNNVISQQAAVCHCSVSAEHTGSFWIGTQLG